MFNINNKVISSKSCRFSYTIDNPGVIVDVNAETITVKHNNRTTEHYHHELLEHMDESMQAIFSLVRMLEGKKCT